jgi:hypothetical protein
VGQWLSSHDALQSVTGGSGAAVGCETDQNFPEYGKLSVNQKNNINTHIYILLTIYIYIYI